MIQVIEIYALRHTIFYMRMTDNTATNTVPFTTSVNGIGVTDIARPDTQRDGTGKEGIE